MTPAALRALMSLVEARKARDLAALDRLLTEDRRLVEEIAAMRGVAARDAAGDEPLPPERQAARLAWAEARVRAAEARRASLSEAIRAARSDAARSLGKHRSLETLAERAERAAAQARVARAEREAPSPEGRQS